MGATMAIAVRMRHRVDDSDAWFENVVGDPRRVGSGRAMRSAENPDEPVLIPSFASRADAELREALTSTGVDQEAVHGHTGGARGSGRRS